MAPSKIRVIIIAASAAHIRLGQSSKVERCIIALRRSNRALFIAQSAILHRDGERFTTLYRLLWRLRSHPDLLDIASDPDVAPAKAMAKAVHRDVHRMQTTVRFREIGREQKAHYVAWYEPEHHIVEATAPFFARRFADMPWSILTPEVCAHWDGHAVAITSGIEGAEAPGPDRLEETWRRHCANISIRRG